MRRPAAFAAALLGVVCCAPMNVQLPKEQLGTGYRFENLEPGDGNTDTTFVILTLSGGGTRAAALSYGVMAELAKAKLAKAEPRDPDVVLLDEVDVISSVSGGSFAAAWYGIHGKDDFVADFPDAVLHRRLEMGLILRILAPWNWPRLLSWWYARSDLADEYYDAHVFGGAKYADLPKVRPLIQLNATDISLGTRFSFIQDHFDRVCSDLSEVSISRGVTASSAFPVAFPPLTFRNYRESAECDLETPIWVENTLGIQEDGSVVIQESDLERNASRYDRARVWKSYEDADRKYIHLSDGGLADNIGLRGPMESLVSPDAEIDLSGLIATGDIKRIVFLVVDAKPESKAKLDRSPHAPGFTTVLNAAATKPMENYSADTVELARNFIDAWQRQAKDFASLVDLCRNFAEKLCGEGAASCRERRRDECLDTHEEGLAQELAENPDLVGPGPAFYRIHVRFEAETNEEIREDLAKIGTRLQLPRDQVKLLVSEGAKLLRESPGYRCLMQTIGDASLGLEPPPEGWKCPE